MGGPKERKDVHVKTGFHVGTTAAAIVSELSQRSSASSASRRSGKLGHASRRVSTSAEREANVRRTESRHDGAVASDRPKSAPRSSDAAVAAMQRVAYAACSSPARLTKTNGNPKTPNSCHDDPWTPKNQTGSN